MTGPYFNCFEDRKPDFYPMMCQRKERLWHFLAGATVGLALWYLFWRWNYSLNPEAIFFSTLVASTETLFFIGTLLFFFDIWREGDTIRTPFRPAKDDKLTTVDIFITTFDEPAEIVGPSIKAASAVICPKGAVAKIFVLDDGNRHEIAKLARSMGVSYISRQSNIGFKAGNLRNALFQTSGDFVLICDADTRIFPTFIKHTLGYFHDPKVAWVQTPHWFYEIPSGQTWGDWLEHKFGTFGRRFSPFARWISGQDRIGGDPFLSDPVLFFDVIQRRRNRHGASFCCGAGSIHRRDAIFQSALNQKKKELVQKSKQLTTKAPSHAVDFQPYRFHVSEDIYTSILLQSDPTIPWRSVYHPQVEARMLSPWSLDAWATQKLKYAGGTFDILLRDNPIFRRGMKWQTKLHYAATFWSYLSVLWTPVLLFAPVFSLLTGLAPVQAYSISFFIHFLPVLITNELAMMVGCKGHNINHGRVMSLSAMPIHLRAFWQTLKGKRPKFPTTPKTFSADPGKQHLVPNLVILSFMIFAGIYGVCGFYLAWTGYSLSFLLVNLFWLTWNGLSIGRILRVGLWKPLAAVEQQRFDNKNSSIPIQTAATKATT